jgi:branched-chain amino acid transport system ATP-binding protein
MSAPLLRVDGLHTGYGEMLVLRDIALEIYEAEIVTLVGSNGAGKTTLLRALSCVLPWRGGITFSGEDLTNHTPDQVFALGLVQVPEGRQLFERMSVQDNLLMGAYRRRDSTAVIQDLDGIYALFPPLAERSRQLARSLSGGEQQMCAIARALMAQPRLMMVDEMSLGLAPLVVEKLMHVLVEIRARGVAVLLVEQDVSLSLSGADRGYVLEMGTIVRSELAIDLISDPDIQRAYFGL